MLVFIVALHEHEFSRICRAARWPEHGPHAPRFLNARERELEHSMDKVRGLSGGLVLIAEGAARHGVSAEMLHMFQAYRMTVMFMQEAMPEQKNKMRRLLDATRNEILRPETSLEDWEG